MGHFSSFNIRHFHPCDPHWGWSHPSWCSNSNHPWIRPLNPQSPCGLLCSSTHRSDSPLLNHFFYARIVEDFAGWMPWNIWNISPLLLTQPHFNHFFTMSWYFKCFSLLDFWICFFYCEFSTISCGAAITYIFCRHLYRLVPPITLCKSSSTAARQDPFFRS